MTQRTLAALLAVPLFVALGIYTAVTPLPFVTYSPGPTINVLGDNDGKPIIEVQGHPTYRDDGELRMTTVSVTQRNARLDLLTLLRTWFSRDRAIYPYAIQYGGGGSQQQDTQEGQVEMIGSQDSAIAAALRQLGYQVNPVVSVSATLSRRSRSAKNSRSAPAASSASTIWRGWPRRSTACMNFWCAISFSSTFSSSAPDSSRPLDGTLTTRASTARWIRYASSSRSFLM